MNHSCEDVATAVLDQYGCTYAQEAGIRLADQPAPLFQLLVLAQVLSARINAGIAMAAAQGIKAAGWTTAARMRGGTPRSGHRGSRSSWLPPVRRTHGHPAEGHGR